MHAETGSWTIFSGWEANCFARIGNALYFGGGTFVAKVGGASDFDANITATVLSAYSQMGYPRNKLLKEIRPYLVANGTFSFTMGVANDFAVDPSTTTINPLSGGTAALWGSGVWGTSVWSGSTTIVKDWRSVPDLYASWKGLYLQVSSKSVSVEYLGADLRGLQGSDF